MKNNYKIMLLVVAVAATGGLFTSYMTADAEVMTQQGKTIIVNEKGSPLSNLPEWVERKQLRSQMADSVNEIEKRQIQTDIDRLSSQIDIYVENRFDQSKYDVAIEKKSLLTDQITKNRENMGADEAHEFIPTVSRGYDIVNNSLRIVIDQRYFEESSLKIYEERIRDVVGNDVDITLLLGGAGKLHTCSDRTTGECEPIEEPR